MMEWEKLLGVQWPKNQCDQSGECCRGAAQIKPWQNLMAQAANGNPISRAFLNQYQPYPNQEAALNTAPDAVQASTEIALSRGENPENLVFYHCIYLKNRNQCQIYEDRPTLCRDFPESPFGAIPKCCGYTQAKENCLEKASQLRQQLAGLKALKAKMDSEISAER
ncbi:YkgJ family cysteine cluster protein [Vampirovibrio sp.]|uniref:YkgJ family cysteine cluster protein n=1 Tax=Vampirovibrio sp. TaxID=2717857 RepID=UPI003593BC7E